MSHRDRIDDEIEFHIEQQTAKNIRAGMTPDAARRAARVKFGAVEGTREAAQDEASLAWLRDFSRDARIAGRSLLRVPGFAITAILTIALGIGAASAMFSVVNAVLLTPLPYPDSGRIVRLNEKTGKSRTAAGSPVALANFLDWQSQSRAFQSMATMANWGQMPVSGLGMSADLVQTTMVSKDFWDVMRVSPAIGRRFTGNELVVNGEPAVIVSHEFWQRAGQAGAPSGQAIQLSGQVFPVVGVMPAGFDYPNGTDLWIAQERQRPNLNRTAHNFQVVARLTDGISLDAARADLSRLSRKMAEDYKGNIDLQDSIVVPILDVLTARGKQTLTILFAASLLLLLVACMNVSNLLVARAANRRREFAVQLAIGASLGRVTRQLIAETLVLAGAGAMAGLGVAALAVRVFVAAGPAGVARLDDIHLSWLSVAFSAGVSIAAALTLGLLTAVGMRSVRIAESLADSTRTGSGSRAQMRTREGLIVAQVALALVLVAAAGLLGRSLVQVLAIDPGFSLDEGVVADVTLVVQSTPESLASQVRRQQEMLDRVRQIPGVTAAGWINGFPIGSPGFANGQFVEMTGPDEFRTYADVQKLGPEIKARAGYANYRLVSDGYFEAMGMPLLKGRLIEAGDTPEAPQVAVISRSLAEAKWPGQDPIDRYIQYGNMDGDMRGIRIVGIVGDVHEGSPETPPFPTVYASGRQRPRQASDFAIVAKGPSVTRLGSEIERAISAVDPESPVKIRTVSSAYASVLSGRRFSLWLIGAFGVVALVLAMLGIYGLVSYAVSQRAREMGIRLALGAEPGSLVGLILKRSLVLAGVGALVGVGLAAWFSSMLKDLLATGVQALDPAVLGSVIAVMLLCAGAASLVPARRVLRQSAAASLRQA